MNTDFFIVFVIFCFYPCKSVFICVQSKNCKDSGEFKHSRGAENFAFCLALIYSSPPNEFGIYDKKPMKNRFVQPNKRVENTFS